MLLADRLRLRLPPPPSPCRHLHAEGWVLPVSDSPKPPADRITLSMPVLNAAKQVAVVALGQVRSYKEGCRAACLPAYRTQPLVQCAAGRSIFLGQHL